MTVGELIAELQTAASTDEVRLEVLAYDIEDGDHYHRELEVTSVDVIVGLPVIINGTEY